jgi:hypothetical protein
MSTNNETRVHRDIRVSLKEYVERLFSSLKESFEKQNLSFEHHIENQIANLKENIILAKSTNDERLAGMNEFRESLKDQSLLFVTKAEYEAVLNKLGADIRELRESRAELKGKADQSQVNNAVILSAIGLALAVVSIIVGFL